MPGLRASVHVDNFFPQIRENLDDLAKKAAFEGAKVGGEVARGVASRRSKSGQMADIRIGSAASTGYGYEASFVSPVYYAWFQNYGTLGNRRKRLKEPPRTDRTRDPGTGVEPLRFLDAGRKAGTAAMIDVIAKGLPR